MVCKYRIVPTSLARRVKSRTRKCAARLGTAAVFGTTVVLAVLTGCSTPAPKTPVGAHAHYPEQLRQAVTTLSLTMDDARRSGLLELRDEADAAVARRAELQSFLGQFYDAVRAVDAISSYYDDRSGEEAFLLRYTGELAIYLHLAELADKTVGVAHYEKIFSEAHTEVGLYEGNWKELKNAFNLQPWQQPLALYQLRHEANRDDYAELGLDRRYAWALGYIDDHQQEMTRRGIGTGPQVFAKDVLDRVTDGFHWVWFPAQKGVAEAMGDTRVVSADRRLISDEQIARATALLRPGDVIVERRNWYLSNIGLPGFWPHTALYVGTPEQVRAEFGAVFESTLHAVSAEASRAWSARDSEGHPLRILEAVSEGVTFTSTEHSLGADFVAAVRPTLDDAERGDLLRSAFAYFGRPYDFDFDFRSDESIVCSELVYKAYGAAAPERARAVPLESIVGRPVLSPNTLVAYYDAHAEDEAPPFRFVFFLDGVEGEGRAYFREDAIFRASHRRPKWDIVQP
jgi:hypothetical protein